MTRDMVLQKRDIDLLKKWGYPDDDIPQIQEAINVSKYELHKADAPYSKVKDLTAAEEYEKAGREQFLSGIARSAFHWDSSRECEKNMKYTVWFNSRALFV